jgi:PST family polysaccharide transporter
MFAWNDRMAESVYFRDHAIDADHGRRSLRAGVAIVGARVLVTVVQISATLVLARLLSPEDYGLAAMVTAITVFAPTLVGLGTPDVVVQRAHITEKQISLLFWISLAIGCGSALLMAACGPIIARFYGEPRLTWISGASGLTFLASALSCQHYSLLRRAMKFEELAAVDFSANLLSAGGAIAMALFGLEYWALVLRPVTTASLITFGVWLQCRWMPKRPMLCVDVRPILRQGLPLMGSQVTEYIAGSSDRIAIGHRSGAIQLGYYQNAMFVYENLCSLLVSSAHNVVVSSLCKAQDNLAEVHRLWRKALQAIQFYSMPTFGLLAVIGHDLVVVLFGSKWAATGVIISILALRGIPNGVERTIGWLHVAAGRPDRWMRWGVIAMCAQLTALFCGLPYGPTGVAVAFVAYSFAFFIPAVTYAGSPLGITAVEVILVIWRPMIASLLAVIIGLILRRTFSADSSVILRITVLSLAYVTTYLAIIVGLFRERMPIQVVLGLLRDALPSRISRYINIQRLFKSGR